MDYKIALEKVENSSLKVVKDVIECDPKWSSEIFQSYYLDRESKRMKPNVVLIQPPEMDVIFSTNGHGFKGAEIDFSKKLVAIWGDSVVFGVKGGWVEGIARYFSAYQFLNGGLEGDTPDNICARAIEKNRELNISYNIIFPGWHDITDPEKTYHLLHKVLSNVPGGILCTVPTSLNEKIVEKDLRSFFTPKDHSTETSYLFWGNIEYSIKNAKVLFTRLLHRNKVVHMVAQERNVPIVDLYSYFHTNSEETLRKDFFDAGHPRISAFPKFQRVFYEELKDVLHC